MSLVRRVFPWVAFLASIALVLTASWLDQNSGTYSPNLVEDVVGTVVVLATGCVGLLIALRQGRNPIGWILLAYALFIAITGFTEAYARYGLIAHPGRFPATDWAVLIEDRSWAGLFAGITAIAYLFPTGKVLAGRWKTMAWITLVSFSLLLLTTPFTNDPFDSPFADVENPMPQVNTFVYGTLLTVELIGVIIGMTGAALSMRSRYKASTGIERQQIRWLALAASLIPISIIVSVTEVLISGEAGVFSLVPLAAAIIAIPAAIAIAVLRYRLYEIDRLVNRTLVYGVLTALSALAFVAVSLLVGVWAGSGSTIATAAATLAVAVAFTPLRSRVQTIVDRRFSRARYQGLRRVSTFLEDLRSGKAAPEEAGAVLAAALEDPTLELYFWMGEAGGYFDSGGRPLSRPLPEGRAEVPVTRASVPLAMVVHDPVLRERPDLLESVISAAGLVIEIARLQVEVNRRLVEVEESRRRIVSAGVEERRRLERDLHDGAQQRLVSIGLNLRHIQKYMPDDEPDAKASIDETVSEVGEVIEELREIARGVRPASLDDGLDAALKQLVARSAVTVELESTVERFDDVVETAAYFVASEALTNSVKHSEASEIRIKSNRKNGSLVLSISDDGIGGAISTPGSGLSGLSDRISAMGGRFEVTSPSGGGTTITAELPCES